MQFIYTGDRARDHYSITEAVLEAERKERKEVVREAAHTRTEGRQTLSIQFLICFDNNASEAEVITDTKKSRKANRQIH